MAAYIDHLNEPFVKRPVWNVDPNETVSDNNDPDANDKSAFSKFRPIKNVVLNYFHGSLTRTQ